MKIAYFLLGWITAGTTVGFLLPSSFVHRQPCCEKRLYAQQPSTEETPPPRRNYFPTRKRGYYEKWLSHLNARQRIQDEKKLGIYKEEATPPRRKWVIWIKPSTEQNTELEQETQENDVEVWDPMEGLDEEDFTEEELAELEELVNQEEAENEDEEQYEKFYPPVLGGIGRITPEEASSSSSVGIRGNRVGGKSSNGGAPKKSDNFEITNNTSVTFQDVGGYDNIKRELLQCTDLLANYTKYAKYNVRIPKGLILEGPPGNGKTLLAKAFSGECGEGVSFIAVSGSQFQEKYVGVGSSRIRELFELARKNVPCIIYIDEMDALGKQRSSDGESSSSERDSTLNELLSQMDGFKHSDGIFVIGSTNRADILDTALTRPGRIDKRIYIGQPDAKTREAILRIHLKGKPCSSNIHMEDLVTASVGFSGAQIENWLNEAMLNALRDDREEFTQQDLDEVVSKVMVGWQPNPHEFQDDLLHRIAIHEMGHAIVGMKCCHHAKVLKVAIQLHSPTSPGITQFETDTHHIYTRDALFEHLMILLGGQVAENNVFSLSTTTGVSDDLNKVYELAEKMILYYGMGSRVVYPKHSEKYKEAVDEEIMILIQDAYKAADYLVKQNLEAVKRGGALLAEKHVLKADEIALLIQGRSVVG